MAQSHRYCDHPATKSARAKCRREREQYGTDYQGGWDDWDAQPPPRPRQRRRTTGCRTCGASSVYGHYSWCPYSTTGTYGAYTPPPPRAATTEIISNANGGYKRTIGYRGQINDAADDRARTPDVRRIVQLERKAQTTTNTHEAAAFLAAALRLRQARGMVGQVL